MASKTQNLVFFHPDLGIGGAERLVIDAAVGLQNRGHRVIIFTSHCDPKHCFDEARDGMSIYGLISHSPLILEKGTEIVLSQRHPRRSRSW